MKKWIIRLLLTIIVMIGVLLSGLHLLSGTGDAQKSGLEDAFSKALGGKVRFDKLEKFNIIPQLAVEVSGFHATYDNNLGNIDADQLAFSFSFIDLIRKKHTIDSFDISNMKIEAGTFFDTSVSFGKMGIEPATADKPAEFVALGKFGTLPMELRVDMTEDKDNIPAHYSFGTENDFDMNIGKTYIDGTFTPATTDNTRIRNISVTRGDKKCEALPENNRFTVQSFRTYVIPALAESELKGSSLEDLCKEMMKYGIGSS